MRHAALWKSACLGAAAACLCWLAGASVVNGAGALAAPGESIQIPVSRDTWVSEVGEEAKGNQGGSPRMKLKSYQEFSLFDIDAAELRGKIIQKAQLSLHLEGKERLWMVTVGSVGAEWVEGDGTNYAPQPGSSSFGYRRNFDLPWSHPGSDLTSVILAQGGTTWNMADASAPDAEGWQHIAVDPLIVALRVAGLSHGFVLFDDTGSEWTRQGEQFQIHPFPNRYVSSKESRRAWAPYMTVVVSGEDGAAPGAPSGLRAELSDDLEAGEAVVSWVSPADSGGSGTAGFVIEANGKSVPRYLIPLARAAGSQVKMHLRDFDFQAGQEVSLSVRAVDAAGNVGQPANLIFQTAPAREFRIPVAAAELRTPGAPLPRLGATEVAILDELDKVKPSDGSLVPPRPSGYLASNHLWDSSTRTIGLHAARGEFVAIQIMFRGSREGIEPTLSWEGQPIPHEFGEYALVGAGDGLLPDPIVPLGTQVPSGAPGGFSSLHLELLVPKDAKAGEHRGKLTLRSPNGVLELPVSLNVWDFTLSDHLSFIPEMNCYGLPSNERDYYRLAHRHRTYLNRVPYSQRGEMSEGCAPGWDGKTLDWAEWDRRFGPLLDGTAFADLPRAGVPIEGFYLPQHENWPTPMEGAYNGDYWADRAFPESYWQAFAEVTRQMAVHFEQKGWRDTLFQGFLNGKNNFKEKGWSRGSSPWLLDEPAHFQDFWALRYFGLAFHQGVRAGGGQARMTYRADISRPQWQRDSLDGLLDYSVSSSILRRYHRLVMDRKAAEGQVLFEYGSTNGITDANTQPVGWSLEAWCLGCDGVLPWQTVGREGSWGELDTLSLFYPAPPGAAKKAVYPSVRLKAYRRGQQDVEYLTWLARIQKAPRWAVRKAVKESLDLQGERRGSDSGAIEDAGVLTYKNLPAEQLHAFRVELGRMISQAAPEPQERLVNFRTPPRTEPIGRHWEKRPEAFP